MDNLIKVLKNEFDFENLNEFDSITDLIKDNDMEEFCQNDITTISIDNKEYYIIKITCDYCGDNFYYISDLKDDIIRQIKIYYDFDSNSDYNTVCQNCVENEFLHCENCGELVHQDEAIWCEDNQTIYCQACAEEYTFTCAECGEIHSVDNRYVTGDDEELCENCAGNGNYYYCDDCGELYYVDRMNYNENSGEYYCDYCYDAHAHCNFDYKNAENRDNENIEKGIKDYEDISAITNYHNNPIDFIKRKSNNDKDNEKLFFGVELEISNNSNSYLNEASAFVADNLFCRIENDSSIPNYGFEIISDPMTLNKWHERKNKINQVFDELINNGFISHNASGGNCGLHIHASREALGDTEAEQENTINNIILITENFKKELQQFSRRKDFNWCHFFNDDTEENKETNIEKIKENKGNKNRYQVINTKNRHTIELRLNRGTLKTNTFFASIQLFYNIIQLAKTKNFINKNWNYLVKMNNFEELQSYVNEREIKSNAKIIETSKAEAEEKQNGDLYESIILLNDNIENIRHELQNIIITIDSKIGKFKSHEKQGIKNLAYEIKGHKQAYYYIVNYYSKSEKIQIFEKFLKENDNVLKFITVKREV